LNPSLRHSVLVVDDDDALRTLFIALLTRAGFDVECVSDGSQALERLANDYFDVILIDLMMPVTNGYDVLRRLGEWRPALLKQTIVTTGESERDLAKFDRDAVFAVLRKPFDVHVLTANIADCIRAHAARMRMATVVDDDEADHSRLNGSIRKFEAALPELRDMLTSTVESDRELQLRGELRRVVGELAVAISAAATVANDSARARRYESVGRDALHLATRRTRSSRREH
jgi:CheY-like chemotaxis protein